MAYDTALVAITLLGGRYSVTAQQKGSLDLSRMEQEGLFRDVSEPSSGYEDRVEILTPAELRPFELGDDSRNWLDALASDVFVVLVHKYEWESGLED